MLQSSQNRRSSGPVAGRRARMSGAANGETRLPAVEITCPRCQECLPAAAKFCGKCGQPLARPGDQAKDFFISYTGVDVEWAHWIAQQLEANGYTTIYQARDFHAGGDFILQMHQAMRASKRTIAVL